MIKRMILASVLAFGLGSGVSALASYAPPIYAPHDSGLGKSQDGEDGSYDLSSISVAPEPETYWLFLIGAAAMGWYLRYMGKARNTAN